MNTPEPLNPCCSRVAGVAETHKVVSVVSGPLLTSQGNVDEMGEEFAGFDECDDCPGAVKPPSPRPPPYPPTPPPPPPPNPPPAPPGLCPEPNPLTLSMVTITPEECYNPAEPVISTLSFRIVLEKPTLWNPSSILKHATIITTTVATDSRSEIIDLTPGDFIDLGPYEYGDGCIGENISITAKAGLVLSPACTLESELDETLAFGDYCPCPDPPELTLSMLSVTPTECYEREPAEPVLSVVSFRVVIEPIPAEIGGRKSLADGEYTVTINVWISGVAKTEVVKIEAGSYYDAEFQYDSEYEDVVGQEIAICIDAERSLEPVCTLRASLVERTSFENYCDCPEPAKLYISQLTTSPECYDNEADPNDVESTVSFTVGLETVPEEIGEEPNPAFGDYTVTIKVQTSTGERTQEITLQPGGSDTVFFSTFGEDAESNVYTNIVAERITTNPDCDLKDELDEECNFASYCCPDGPAISFTEILTTPECYDQDTETTSTVSYYVNLESLPLTNPNGSPNKAVGEYTVYVTTNLLGENIIQELHLWPGTRQQVTVSKLSSTAEAVGSHVYLSAMAELVVDEDCTIRTTLRESTALNEYCVCPDKAQVSISDSWWWPECWQPDYYGVTFSWVVSLDVVPEFKPNGDPNPAFGWYNIHMVLTFNDVEVAGTSGGNDLSDFQLHSGGSEPRSYTRTIVDRDTVAKIVVTATRVVADCDFSSEATDSLPWGGCSPCGDGRVFAQDQPAAASESDGCPPCVDCVTVIPTGASPSGYGGAVSTTLHTTDGNGNQLDYKVSYTTFDTGTLSAGMGVFVTVDYINPFNIEANMYVTGSMNDQMQYQIGSGDWVAPAGWQVMGTGAHPGLGPIAVGAGERVTFRGVNTAGTSCRLLLHVAFAIDPAGKYSCTDEQSYPCPGESPPP